MTLHIAFATLYWIWIASEVITVLVTRTRRSSGETRDRGSMFVLWVVIFGSFWTALQYGATHPRTILPGAHWLAPACFVLFVAGVAMRWTAILTLGKSFSVNVAIHTTQKVKQDGLYRVVRHPSYTALLLIFLAIGLDTRNWISLAILVVLPTLALLYRIHVEEAALNGAFGAEYARYSRSTKRLIPGIY